jgi:hypothetical protein
MQKNGTATVEDLIRDICIQVVSCSRIYKTSTNIEKFIAITKANLSVEMKRRGSIHKKIAWIRYFHSKNNYIWLLYPLCRLVLAIFLFVFRFLVRCFFLYTSGVLRGALRFS